MSGSVVLLSGGLDSAVCLKLAAKWKPIHAVFIDYGQQAAVQERLASERLAWRFADRFHVRAMAANHDDGLTGDGAVTAENMVLPGRNMLMLTYAAALAQKVDAGRIVMGVTETDYDDFPDCRPAFMRAAERALILAFDRLALIETPLIRKSKKQVVRMALDMGLAVGDTWSCYSPVNGNPCGVCPACQRRELALLAAGVGCAS